MWRVAAAAATLHLAGCAAPAPAVPEAGGPAFDPLAFFQGRAGSDGTITEDFGSPERFASETHGVPEPGGLLLLQHFTYADGHTEDRVWHLRRDAPGRISGVANDAVGTAHGETDGSRFHWRWVLATQPGNWLRNVWLDQVMVLRPDGTVLNRATVSKLGLPAARVEETFHRTAD